ncbi:MAG: hypothetical protein RL693_1924, partial [Verrucomicrobiota bacterium]
MERSEPTSPPEETQRPAPASAGLLTHPDMSSVETTKIPPWSADSTVSLAHEPQNDHSAVDDLAPGESPEADDSLTEEPSPTRRQPILSEDQDKSSLLLHAPHPDTTYMVNHSRSSNQRRSKQVGKLLILMFAANLLMLTAGGLWLYNRFTEDLEVRISQANTRAPVNAAVTQAAPPAEPASKIDPQYQSRLVKLESSLQEAQERLLNAEEQNRRQAASLEALAANSTAAPSSKTVPVANTEVPAPMVGDPALPLQQSELVLLKERNRLTSYADEAIATASRTSYEKLWTALEDPRLANLVHATRSEILRVQNY